MSCDSRSKEEDSVLTNKRYIRFTRILTKRNESDRIFTKGTEVNGNLQSLQPQIQGVEHALEQTIRTMPPKTQKNCEKELQKTTVGSNSSGMNVDTDSYPRKDL
jgi:hypothetical protein